MTGTHVMDAALGRYLSAISEQTLDHPGSHAGHAAGHADDASASADATAHPTAQHRVKRVVGDVMTHGVVAAHEEAVFKEIVDAITRNGISAVPVIDSERRVLGVVSESDLLTRIVGEQGTAPLGVHHSKRDTRRKLHGTIARDLMTTPAVTVTPRTTVADAARIAARHRVRRLPVVTDAGVLIGIVTRADMLAVFLRDDGDIREDVMRFIRYRNEFDRSPITVEVKDGVVTLSGEMERALLAARLVNGVRRIDGVVDVTDHLRFRFDDTILPPPRGGMY